MNYTMKSEGTDDLSNGHLIISLCKEKNGNFYLPDIGYELPADSALIKKAKEIKTLLISNKLLMHHDHDSYACIY